MRFRETHVPQSTFVPGRRRRASDLRSARELPSARLERESNMKRTGRRALAGAAVGLLVFTAWAAPAHAQPAQSFDEVIFTTRGGLASSHETIT